MAWWWHRDRLMEWWDRRSGLSAVSPTDRDGRGHSQTDLAYVRGVHRDHRKWPITAPHSPLPVSRSRSDPPALSLSLSLRGFRTFHFPACAGIVDRTREDVEITRWWNNRMTILFAAQKRLLARIRARNYLLYPVRRRLSRAFYYTCRFSYCFSGERGRIDGKDGRKGSLFKSMI